MLSDLNQQMRQLNEATQGDAHNRVFIWRKVLTEVYLKGFEAGREAERRDTDMVERIARAEAAQAEEAGR